MSHTAEPTAPGALERLDPKTYRGRYVVDHYARYCYAAQWVAGKRVLDIACGFGYGSHLLKQAGASQVVGVDIAPDAIVYAQEHYAAPGIDYRILDAEQADELPDLPFDIVVSFETIEHLREPRRFIEACKRVCHNDSLLICSVPNEADSPPSNPFHRHFFDRESFDQLLAVEFGFREIVPIYMSLAAVVAQEPIATGRPPLRAQQGLVVEIDEDIRRADGFVAVCSRREKAPIRAGLIAQSRKSYDEAEQDVLWLEQQRLAWMHTAEAQRAAFEQERLAAQQGAARDREHLAAWRTLAQERERTLEAQERVNQQLESFVEQLKSESAELRQRLFDASQRMQAAKRKLQEVSTATAQRMAALEGEAARLDRELQSAHATVAAMRGTIAWRVAEKLRRLLPAQSRRGQAVRKPLRWARRIIRGTPQPANT